MDLDSWLKEAKIVIEPLEAELIALNCLAPMGADRSWLVTHGDLPLDGTMEMDEMVARRMGGEPLAYVLGTKWFYGRKFVVNRDVLIPRPETESLIELVKTLDLPLRPRFLDVGTGSGCIGITLALEYPQSYVMATDLSTRALDMASSNDVIHEGRVDLLQSNLLRDLELEEDEKHFDVVVANLPYVSHDWEWIDEQALGYEPSKALFAHNNGLSMYQRFFKEIGHYEKAGKLWIDYVVIEADPCQHEALIKMSEKAALRFVKKDGFGLMFEDGWRYWWDEQTQDFVHKPQEVLDWELEHGVVHWLPEEVEREKRLGDW